MYVYKTEQNTPKKNVKKETVRLKKKKKTEEKLILLLTKT